MARAKKEYRELTVSEAANYGRKTAPMLRIQGLWFQELGFNIGEPVLVKCEEGKIVIMKDSTRKSFTDSNFISLSLISFIIAFFDRIPT